jgi:O-antigen ligase/polysaccharide polymerase Wzy-like membrane protein
MRTATATAPGTGSIGSAEPRWLLPRWLEEFAVARAALAVAAILVVGAAASLGPLVGAMALAVVAFTILVAYRPLLGVVVMVAVVPVTSGLARGMPVPGFRVSELVTALVAGTILITIPRERTRPWALFDLTALAYAVATLGFGTADLALRHAAVSLEDVGRLVGPFQFLLIYRTTLLVVDRPRDRLMCLYALVAASVPVALLGILQGLDIGPFRQLAQNLTDSDLASSFSFQVLARATGPFDHWQALGGYLFIVILIGVALLTKTGSSRARWALIGCLALAASALLLSASIAPAVCAVLGAAAITVWASRRRGWARLRPVLIVGLAALVVALVFLPVIDQRAALQFDQGPSGGHTSVVPQSLAYRYDVWGQQYLPALQAHWLIGYGPELPPGIQWQFTESLYLTLLLRGGVVLLLTFIGLMIAAALRARAAVRDADEGTRVAGRVLLIAIIALIPMHAEMPYFVDAGLPHVFWILAAIAGSRALAPGTSARTALRRGVV